jgi:hypothetical protein
MIFPEGIEYNFYTNKFGTPKMSALYTLANIKKDPSMMDESLLVTLPPSLFNSIVAEVVRWNDVISNLSIHPNPLQAGGAA